MQKRRLIYTAIKRPFFKKKYKIFNIFNLGTGPFPFPRHGKGSRNEVDRVLFRSATSWAIYFFLFTVESVP